MPRMGGDQEAFRARRFFDEPYARLRAEHKSGRGKHSRLQTRRRDDRNLPATVRHRPAGARIDDVAVPPAVDREAANVVARGGDAAIPYADAAPTGTAWIRWILQANVPARVAWRRTDYPKVVTKIPE